jgi:hypothetical protein
MNAARHEVKKTEIRKKEKKEERRSTGRATRDQ